MGADSAAFCSICDQASKWNRRPNISDARSRSRPLGTDCYCEIGDALQGGGVVVDEPEMNSYAPIS